jgi:FemAB-related protein (PEP-CTERM system-associated)
MIVSILKSDEEPAWDAFVRGLPSGTFFHLSGWRHVVERAFGHRTFYLLVRRGAEICGILPLTHVKSLLFGNSLISNAYCVRGGIVANDSEARDALQGEAFRLACDLGAGWIEYRDAASVTASIPRNGLYANFRRPIEHDDAANMKSIPRKQRAVLRKAIATGLRAEIDPAADRLHDIYARSVRRLGSPVFPLPYFRLLKQVFGEACDVVTILHEDRPVASVMNFYFRDEVLPYYGGGIEEARNIGANDFLYWEVMRRAAARGFRIFDFGRSKIGTGAYHYKCNWGFEPEPLQYQVVPVRRRQIPEINPLNPKFRLAGKLWRHLPLELTKVMGPLVVRSIG